MLSVPAPPPFALFHALTFLDAVHRQLSPKETKNLAEIAWRYRHRGVVGFDLAGPEDGFSSKQHQEAFAIVRRQCVNVTLHSGEAAGWESILDSIRYCGAQRLGHGVRLTESDDLLRYVVDQRIAVEACVTRFFAALCRSLSPLVDLTFSCSVFCSNLQTKAVKSLEEHPIRRFFDEGVLIVPCTDNPTVSGVTLSGLV